MSACGGPVLRNAPRPNSAVVAGAVAATAAAITLADPDAAARRVAAEKEINRPVGPDPRSSGETAPADVLDRLDAAQRASHPVKPQPPGATRATPATPPTPGPASDSPAIAPSKFFPTSGARPPER
jgi:hypothetical protein